MKKQQIFRSIISALVLQAVILPSVMFAQTSARADINASIRKEGMENSKIMNTLHYFTDVYGPRLTGSPNHVAAAKWAVKEMTSWGFSNAALEPWDFGHPGWVNERATGLMISPVKDTLTFEVLAWTPGTNGVVTSDAVNIILPERPTIEELKAYFETVKGKVAGKIVLVGKPAVVPVTITPPATRMSDEALKLRFGDDRPTSPQAPRRGPDPTSTPKPGALNQREIDEQIALFLVANKAALRINDAAMDHGLVRAFNNRTFDVTKAPPTVILRNDDFGRIARLLADNTTVSLEFDIRNRTIPEGATSYNVVAEIPGTDKKDEVIMLGGHLDSWHAATGATDNAIGCAVMMEAARILKSIGVKPRRTIRVALWSGEEQGLLGSQAYVKQHFGSAESPGPDYGKFNGYFNIDSGTGRARGMSIFGPPEATAILREALSSYSDLGFAGVISSTSRGLGGSDHTSFANAGLPGIGVGQDPIEYFTHTWHTNLDTYERIIESDVKSSAVIIAAAVYALAMNDSMIPRFDTDKMPELPAS